MEYKQLRQLREAVTIINLAHELQAKELKRLNDLIKELEGESPKTTEG